MSSSIIRVLSRPISKTLDILSDRNRIHIHWQPHNILRSIQFRNYLRFQTKLSESFEHSSAEYKHSTESIFLLVQRNCNDWMMHYCVIENEQPFLAFQQLRPVTSNLCLTFCVSFSILVLPLSGLRLHKPCGLLWGHFCSLWCDTVCNLVFDCNSYVCR